jgi:alpha-1,6-mannosyltransferase
VAIVAVVLATVAFLSALQVTWRGGFSAGFVIGVGIAFLALSVALPLLLSRDVYSYAIYGRMASVHHVNPYVSTPFDFPTDPFFPLVGPQWRGTTAVYGPAFTMLSSGLTRVLHSPASLILAYKVIAAVAALITTLVATRLARRVWPERAAFAAALIVWNPVVVFHAVGGGHNDLLIGLAIAIALWLLVEPGEREGRDPGGRATTLREMGATAALALGALVKATAAVPLVFLIVALAWRRPPGRRLAAFGAHVGLALALLVAFGAPYFQTHDPAYGLVELSSHEGWLAPSRFFGVLLGYLGEAAGGDLGSAVVHGIVRVAFPATFGVAFLFIVREVIRRGASLDVDGHASAWGWGLLLATLAAPVLLPWYVVWLLPLVWLLPTTPRIAAIVVSIVLTVSQTVAAAVNFPTIFHGTLFFGHYFLTPVLFATFVVLLVDLRRRVGDGVALEEERAAPRPPGRHVATRAG